MNKSVVVIFIYFHLFPINLLPYLISMKQSTGNENSGSHRNLSTSTPTSIYLLKSMKDLEVKNFYIFYIN